MKSTAFVTTAAVVAAFFSFAANAQTGSPSAVEVRAQAEAPHVVANDEELGSYARYLMLNGATREAAVAAARNIDHPQLRSRLASRAPAGAQPPVRQ